MAKIQEIEKERLVASEFGRNILSQSIRAGGVERLTETDLLNLIEMSHFGQKKFITEENMKLLQEYGHAQSAEIYGVKNRFARVLGTYYQKIESGPNSGRWYALPEKFFEAK